MSNCLFCSIAAGDIPASIVLQEPDVVAFHDVNPQAPVHVLVIPTAHHRNVAEAVDSDPALVANLMGAVGRVARELGLDEGFRVVFNTGADGGQTVDHVHAHVLAGRQMSWPPG